MLGRMFVPDTGKYPLPARRVTLGHAVDPRTGTDLDQALATCFPSPNSYTGEDVVELSLHGSPVIVAAVLDCLCACGARLAEPGEFTMRAFLNGKLDLAQAEAVADVIAAKTLYQAQVAARQSSGELSRSLEPIKRLLIDIVVNLESAVEFVEEDLPVLTREALASRLDEVQRRLDHWIDSYRRGRIVRDGFNLAVVGRPNVGKSSLFNALLAQERSIVTDIPGTTRDLVSEFASFGGIPVCLVDTAGVRDSPDRVEQLGVDRSFRAMADADATILVVDTSRAPSPEDEYLKGRLAELPCILAMNKSDLPCVWSADQMREFAGQWARIEVSAKYGTNVPELRSLVMRHVFGDGALTDGILVTNLRHCRCLESARESLSRAGHRCAQECRKNFPSSTCMPRCGSSVRSPGKRRLTICWERSFPAFASGSE